MSAPETAPHPAHLVEDRLRLAQTEGVASGGRRGAGGRFIS
jgi:hypothetical protein